MAGGEQRSVCEKIGYWLARARYDDQFLQNQISYYLSEGVAILKIIAIGIFVLLFVYSCITGGGGGTSRFDDWRY